MGATQSFDFCILDIDNVSEGDKSCIRMWGIRDGKFSVVIDSRFEPYFYVEPKGSMLQRHLEALGNRIMEVEINGEKPARVEVMEKKFLGRQKTFLKVVLANPSNLPSFREALREWSDIKDQFEYNIPFYRRYMIDRGLTPMSWIRVTGTEIESALEVDSVFELEKMELLEKNDYPELRMLAFDLELVEEEGEEKIIMISLQDTSGFRKVLTCKNVHAEDVEILKDERELLEKFMSHVRERDPHILVGYNTDTFEFPKLQQRCEKHGLEMVLGRDGSPVAYRRRGKVTSAQIKGRVHLDLYNYVENMLSQTLTSDVLTLDRVAREILGTGKKKMRWEEMQDIWTRENDMEKLVDYCMYNSYLSIMLAEEIVPQIFEMCRVAAQTPFDASRMTYSQLVESVLMWNAYREQEVIPNRPGYEEMNARRKAAPYTGGYVHPPKEGIHENIAVFDFRSLYPSIIVSHNVSPETLDCECCKNENRVPEGNHHYCMKNEGFIPSILRKIIDRRMELSRKMKKCDPDSQEYRRLYNQQFAFKTLSNAFYGYFGYAGSRWYSRVCAEAITSWGRYYIKDVISKAESQGFEVIYGDTDSLFLKMRYKKNIKDFARGINESLPGIMELDFKDLYKRGIFIETRSGVAAKKKYALLDSRDRLMIRGLETRRRDWAPIAKRTQKDVLLAVLKEASIRKAIEIVRETIRRLKSGEVEMKDLVIYTQLTKRINQYEQVGPHVAAARKALERGKPVGQGTVISYIVTRGAGSISNRAEPAEYAKDYDPDYYIHHQVIPLAMRILSGLDVTEEDLLKKQSSLEKFMKFIRK